MSLGSTPVVWLKSGLSHLIRSPSCAKTVRLTAAVAYVKKGNNVPRSSREMAQTSVNRGANRLFTGVLDSNFANQGTVKKP